MGLDEIRRLKEAAGQPKEKKVYRIPKKSAKKIQQEAAAKEEQKGGSELVKWFKGRIKFMTGKCANCGERTETKKYEFAVGSIAHILEKRNSKFPEVKYHPLNFIELCYPCHTNYDSFWSWDEKEKMKCWDTIVERFIMMYPEIPQEKHRLLPDNLLKHIKEPF